MRRNCSSHGGALKRIHQLKGRARFARRAQAGCLGRALRVGTSARARARFARARTAYMCHLSASALLYPYLSLLCVRCTLYGVGTRSA